MRAIWLTAFCLGMSAAYAAHSADIQYTKSGNGVDVIHVSGELREGDDARFKNIAVLHNRALVVLDGPGGAALAAIEIGRTIAIKGFSTAVLSGSVCASACGLIWLAGIERFLHRQGMVGFHAVYRDASTSQEVSSDGNALVGSYLRQLGLSDAAIVYVTKAAPNSMRWLLPKDAEAINLRVTLLGAETSVETAVSRPLISAVERSAHYYIEVPGNPQPMWRSAGVKWSSSETELTPGQTAVRVAGAVRVPGEGWEASISFEPASPTHPGGNGIVQWRVRYDDHFNGKRFNSLAGIAFKQSEAERGQQLVGRITGSGDSATLAMSSEPSDRATNSLMIGMPWIDLPVTLSDGTRALISLEVDPVTSRMLSRMVER